MNFILSFNSFGAFLLLLCLKRLLYKVLRHEILYKKEDILYKDSGELGFANHSIHRTGVHN